MSNHVLPGFGRYIVTVKMPRNPAHNPRAKQTSGCVASSECTDSTGEHHSILVETDRLQEVLERYEHVTRVERVTTVVREVPDQTYAILCGLSGSELLLRSDLTRAAMDAYSVVFEPSRKEQRDHEKAVKAGVAAALLRMSEEHQRMTDGERCCGPAPEPQCLRCGAPDEVAGWLRVTALRLDPDIEKRDIEEGV